MSDMGNHEPLRRREAAVEMPADQFRALGYQVIDRIADFLATLQDRPVTPTESPQFVRKLLGDDSLPEAETDPEQLLREATELLF